MTTVKRKGWTLYNRARAYVRAVETAEDDGTPLEFCGLRPEVAQACEELMEMAEWVLDVRGRPFDSTDPPGRSGLEAQP